ncbi:hypothetical protein FHL15_008611 [Xylaria flabelliformis]|uniref:Uncharacterized protein n=1 Tax=Xylaria flabelliformis TaxID=2512241 RepID=A0A553HR72_9PEZI|nr:hypothetical protein FHL15_008611 [Xylaria flabelliformis]
MPPYNEGSNRKDTGVADATTQRDEHLDPFPAMLEWMMYTTETPKTFEPGKLTVHRVPPPGCSGEEPEKARKTVRERLTGAKSM